MQGDPGANITIDTLCSIMRDSSYGTVLDRYAAVNTLILKTYSEPCLEISYTKMIKDLKSIDWNSSAAEGGKLISPMLKAGTVAEVGHMNSD